VADFCRSTCCIALGGRAVAEYTNATHTQLVDAEKRAWSPEIFDATGLVQAAAPPLVLPGTLVGKLTGDHLNMRALEGAELIAPACHDTASAIASIPDSGDDWAYISSGTWSLVGTVLNEPIKRRKRRRRTSTTWALPAAAFVFIRA
jgi:rhamnulokinase